MTDQQHGGRALIPLRAALRHQVRYLAARWRLNDDDVDREVFARHSATVQVLHIGTFLRWSLQCPQTYNDSAYTSIIDQLQIVCK